MPRFVVDIENYYSLSDGEGWGGGYLFELKAQMYFSAAHHLLNYEGECEHQHGHNWLVEAYVKGENLDKSNILVDYKVLKREMKAVLDLTGSQGN